MNDNNIASTEMAIAAAATAAAGETTKEELLPTSSSRRLTPRLTGKHGDNALLLLSAAAVGDNNNVNNNTDPEENKTKSFYQRARQQFLSSKKLVWVGILLMAVSSRLLMPKSSRLLDLLSSVSFVPVLNEYKHISAAEAALTFETMSRLERKRDLPCEKGTSIIPHPIVLNLNSIRSHPRTRLEKLAPFTEEFAYARRMVNSAGNEPYTLLHYITQHYGDCRHVADVGTLYAASALALGATGTPVRSYDVPRALEDRQKVFRGITEVEWSNNLVETGVEISFFNVHILNMVPRQFASHFNTTWLIYLDTNHLPYSKPFEREFFQRLVAMRFKGIVLVDDIHGPGTFGGETERWWYELIDHEENLGYKCHDLTEVGHFSGTGLVDFSGMVKVVK